MHASGSERHHWTLIKIPSGGYFADIGNISRISAFEAILRNFRDANIWRLIELETRGLFDVRAQSYKLKLPRFCLKNSWNTFYRTMSIWQI